MKNLTNYIGMAILLSLGCITVQQDVFGACCGRDQREQSVCPNESCDWGRSDGKCDQDEDCCPGRSCNSFGYCIRCRA